MLSTLAAALNRKYVLRSCLLPVIIILYIIITWYYYIILFIITDSKTNTSERRILLSPLICVHLWICSSSLSAACST